MTVGKKGAGYFVSNVAKSLISLAVAYAVGVFLALLWVAFSWGWRTGMALRGFLP